MFLSPILIPIIALAIPLVAVLGRVIVQPIVKAVTQLAQLQAAGQDTGQLDRRTAQIEARLDGIEQVLGRLADDYEFRKALESPAPRALDAPASPTASSVAS